MPCPHTLKFSLFLATSAVLAPGAAMAQDAGWTGLYLGGSAGAAWHDFDYHFTFNGTDALGATNSTGESGSSFIGSVFGGYNFQSGNAVFGIEGDATFGDIDGDSTLVFVDPPDPDDSFSAKSGISEQGSIRGRMGYVWDRFMLFGTAGLAIADVSTSVTAISTDGSFPTSTFSKSKTLYGWTVGAGGEYALNDHWVARLEYRHNDYGDFSFTFNSAALTPFYGPDTIKTSVVTDEVRVGIAYRF